jgi:activator of HSP90 ATPase
MDEKVTRRRVGLILGGLGAATAGAQTKTSAAVIHQDVDFKAAPARIYAILLDAKEFGALTKDTAEIQPQAGAPFKLFGGRIEGRNVELVPNQRIVQAWRSAGWPSGVYSIVRFELTPHGGGTRIAFDHTGFPEGQGAHLSEGWVSNYWEPLHKYLNG